MPNLLKYGNNKDAKFKRYQKILELTKLKPEHRVLDAGSGHGFSFEQFNFENEIVGLDLEPSTTISQPNFKYVQGDATDMKMFKDKEFDLVVSVGVFEHIRPRELFIKMANEIQRVGKGYAIIVPDRMTIIEPHYQFPFWQLYPKFLKRFTFKHWNLGIYHKDSNGNYEDLVFLKRKEWRKIFPGCQIYSYNHRAFGPFGIIRNTIIYKEVE